MPGASSIMGEKERKLSQDMRANEFNDDLKRCNQILIPSLACCLVSLRCFKIALRRRGIMLSLYRKSMELRRRFTRAEKS